MKNNYGIPHGPVVQLSISFLQVQWTAWKPTNLTINYNDVGVLYEQNGSDCGAKLFCFIWKLLLNSFFSSWKEGDDLFSFWKEWDDHSSQSKYHICKWNTQ
jgi:hypothetical protein